MKKISSKIISHSVANNIELITIQTKAPKFLDAEFEKHRIISSNSSSDRAIPFLKMLDSGYYLPDDIRLNQPGMQGDLLLDEDSKEAFWSELKGIYGYTSEKLKAWDKVHKQHLNRYLMGFSWQNKIASATEWENFFNLRLHRASDPAMYQLAKCMKEAMDSSTPKELKPGEWHLPYVDARAAYMSKAIKERILEIDIKCSVARVARVSYNNHDGSDPVIEKDIELHDDLLEAGHMSPTEHQATPMYWDDPNWEEGHWIEGVTHQDKYGGFWSGNFKSWIQYRQLIEVNHAS